MTTAVREWRDTIRSRDGWGSGPWDDEPDKVQWVDQPTGLDCLIVRNGLGAWCGYVGVAEGHPYFGVGYSQCPEHCGKSWCAHSPESKTEVHGGLTFAEFCDEPTREAWSQWRTSMQARRQEARDYPRGDAARAFREAGHLLDDYEAWRAYGEARFICHTPEPGRPARVWWLGFDCAHCQDLTPGLHRTARVPVPHEVYRDRAYVASEVAKLAAQLAAIGGAR